MLFIPIYLFSSTAEITKGDIIQQHIDTQSVRCRQYHFL